MITDKEIDEFSEKLGVVTLCRNCGQRLFLINFEKPLGAKWFHESNQNFFCSKPYNNEKLFNVAIPRNSYVKDDF